RLHDARPRGLAQTLTKTGIIQHALERRCKRRRVLDGGEHTRQVRLDTFLGTAAACGDDRPSRGHGFEKGERQALAARAGNEYVEVVVQRRSALAKAEKMKSCF